MPAMPSLLIELLGGGLDNAVALSGSPGAVLAIIAAAGLFFTLAVASYPAPATTAGPLHLTAVRRRAEQTLYLPLCDPAAAGRPRPRAPSAHRRAA